MPSVGTASLDLTVDKNQVGRSISGAVEGQHSRMASIGKALGAALLGGFAVAKAFDFLGDSIAEAREAAKVGRLTNQVIESTGGAAKVSAGHVGDLANSLSNLAGVDDEMIQTGENVLLTFTNIRNAAGKGNDIFDQAAKAALDLSQSPVGNGDMAASAVQLGKALNDPIKGVSALTRVGVSFTQQQKDQIKALVESGDTLGAQKIILKELNTEFGGAAAAAADPAQRLGVAWGNLKEQVGTAILPVLSRFATFLADNLPGAAAAAGRAFDAVKRVVGPVVDLVKTGIGALRSAFSGDGITSDGFVGVMERIGVAMRQVVDFVEGNLKPILIGLGIAFIAFTGPITAVVLTLGILYAKFEGVRNVVDAVVGFVIQQVGAFAGFVQQILPAVQEAIGHFVAAAQAAWHMFGDDILAFATGIWTAISGVIQGAVQIIENIIRLALAVINGDWGKAWNALKGIVGGAWTAVHAVVSGAVGALKGIVGAGFNALSAAASAGAGALVDFVKGLPHRILSAIGDLSSLLVHVGAAIMKGLVKGIVSGLGGLKDTLTSIPGKIVSWKGPIDYDRTILVPAGHAIMQGLQSGIRSQLPALRKTLDTVTGTLANVAPRASGGVAVGAVFGGRELADWSADVTLELDGAVLARKQVRKAAAADRSHRRAFS